MLGLFLIGSTSTIPIVCITTIVLGLTAATALMSAIWLPGNTSEKRSDSSRPVVWSVPTKMIATSAEAAISSVSLSVAGASGSLKTI